jgi:hypothetical protein
VLNGTDHPDRTVLVTHCDVLYSCTHTEQGRELGVYGYAIRGRHLRYIIYRRRTAGCATDGWEQWGAQAGRTGADGVLESAQQAWAVQASNATPPQQPCELYDISADPGERENLLMRSGQRYGLALQQMQQELRQHLSELYPSAELPARAGSTTCSVD